ncbi:MAG: protein kinase [Myxococcales bacterium]|nr:protein kinase [Myxococcales bacterium]
MLSERYRLDTLLGEGAMGRVYAAEHVMMRKRVAVKVLHSELTRVPEVVGRFEREAMAAANIDHPNVAAATDFGKLEDGSIYLVLEFVEGRNLRDELKHGPIPVGRALHITRQMAGALAAAHALNIVHRDLKPENVMLVKKAHDPDFVKVLDFGIAKVPLDAAASPGSQAGSAITRVGMVFGTPEYMAPEQALGKEVDNRADIYALGVILFEMLCGLRPFDEKDELGVLGQQLSKPVPALAERVPGTSAPEAVESLIKRLLRREASERPSQALEVARALDGLLAQIAPELMTVVPGSIPGTASYPGTGSYPGIGRFPSSASLRAVATVAQFNPDTPAPGETEPASEAPATLASDGSRPSLTSAGDIDPSFPAAAPGKAGGASDDWFDGIRSNLPPRLQELPKAVLLGAPAALLGVGIVVVLVLVGALATHVPEPASSGSGAASGEPVVEPSNQASNEEIVSARKDGVEALEKLGKTYPEDTSVMLELARAYALKERRVDAVDVIEKAIQKNPDARKDPGVASTLWVAAQDDESQDRAFALLEGPMGAKGADIIYDLVTTDGVKHKVVSRAEKWLAGEQFQKNSSPALNIAVALRQAKSCRQRHGLLLRAKNVGDKRALPYLHRFASPTGCGRGGRGDCNPCLRRDDLLKQSIEAIEKRSGT